MFVSDPSNAVSVKYNYVYMFNVGQLYISYILTFWSYVFPIYYSKIIKKVPNSTMKVPQKYKDSTSKIYGQYQKSKQNSFESNKTKNMKAPVICPESS